MGEALPIHVVSPDPERRDRMVEAVSPPAPIVHESLDEVSSGAGETPHVVLVDVGREGPGPLTEVLELCREVADHDQERIILLADEDGTSFTFRPLSVGFPVTGEDLAGAVDPDGDSWPPFELHEILRFVARVRHDINNPLTAGMAETQLLLMDHGEEGELGESLATIQRQLKRIQLLVQDLAHLRRPPSPKA